MNKHNKQVKISERLKALMTGMCINTVMQCIYVQTKTKPISQRNNHPEEHRIHPIREGLLHEAQPYTHRSMFKQIPYRNTLMAIIGIT